MPVGNVRPLNQVQRIPEISEIANRPLTTPATSPGVIEEVIYTVPEGKKARIRGTFTTDSAPTNATYHQIILDDASIETIIYQWLPGGNSDTFSPLDLKFRVGVTTDFVINAGTILKHKFESSTGLKTSTLTNNLKILEVPA